MNAAIGHLLWKEYRAIRAFWLALVMLSLGMQALVLATSSDANWGLLFVYNVALATPAFFAVGSAGTAFALEKEEGTFDWLQASPTTGGQVLMSKLGLTALATVVMFALLWPLAMWLNGGRLPQADALPGMLGLWPLAALEGLAWGALFSLRSTRPLPAIVLALFATSTIVHLLSYAFVQPTQREFRFEPYLSAVPLRLLIVGLILAADVYLGRQWLASSEPRLRRQSRPNRRNNSTLAAESTDSGSLLSANARQLDRGMMLAHLAWQHMRQSWRLMLLLPAIQLAATWLVHAGAAFDYNNFVAILPIAGVAALMGAAVFQPDQERRNYRFFVEHNVPPRYVWFTRVVPWLAVATVPTLLATLIWIGPYALKKLLIAGLTIFQVLGQQGRVEFEHWYTLPPLAVGLAAAAMAFAGGQWVSMYVRSGLLSGFFALVLAALLLGWTVLVYLSQLSWLLFLAPVPLVFLWLTWLRAPDWIQDNTATPARVRAIVSTVVPSLLLLTLAPLARIAQVDVGGPGFSPEAFVAEITPEALATGNIYRLASERTTFPHRLHNRPSDTYAPLLTADEQAALGENTESLSLIVEASGRPECVLANPATLTDWPVLQTERVYSLLIASGRQLEADGKLNEALERYLLAFTVHQQLANHAPDLSPSLFDSDLAPVLREIVAWGAHPQQTTERLRAGIDRLYGANGSILNTEEGLKGTYILDVRALNGSQEIWNIVYSNPKSAARMMLVSRLMPWERARQLRVTNLMSLNLLHRAASLRMDLENNQAVDPRIYNYLYDRKPDNEWPHFAGFLRWTGEAALSREIAFETQRRATLLTLACQAYRIDHGKLPASLGQLTTSAELGLPYLIVLPRDPHTGRDFVYYPQGLPEPRTRNESALLARAMAQQEPTNSDMKPGRPALWSPGPSLVARSYNTGTPQEPGEEIVYYLLRDHLQIYPYRGYEHRLDELQAWLHGRRFLIPIPLKFPVHESDAEPAPEKTDGEKSSATVPGPSSDVEDLFRDQDSNESGEVQPK
jgi:hypothetical protein